jgi:hypothetical protein
MSTSKTTYMWVGWQLYRVSQNTEKTYALPDKGTVRVQAKNWVTLKLVSLRGRTFYFSGPVETRLTRRMLRAYVWRTVA